MFPGGMGAVVTSRQLYPFQFGLGDSHFLIPSWMSLWQKTTGDGVASSNFLQREGGTDCKAM